ncbi:MAG TPA: hydantoinase/oxoprolinase family protein [Acidimicrobiales bacterium]|nr:hydantoinase/oxoprolinase family protein [Acidimicrobiales bacterium]
MTRYRVSMDIGGTFTDVVAYDEGQRRYAAGKSSTTPADLTEGVFAALGQVVDSPGDISFTVHGTTQGLNAFLQRRGAKVLLLVTEGTGDVYQIARGPRMNLYDLHYRKPAPLVKRRDTIEIPGRLDYAGRERFPLDEAAVRQAAARFRTGGFESIAVCLLFSYRNPEHELRAAQLLREELGAGVPLSLSHAVAREWREYERTSSTVLDAYTGPTVRRYLERLESEMRRRGLGVTLHVMQSSGGMVSAAAARDVTLQTLLSGPVGGTMGGVALSRLLGRPNLICIDMGGTSFDVSLVVDGKPDVSTETTLEGFPLLMSVVNIHTIGAGGGSIAYEEAGGLRVGPESAGAEPGPAAYGRGGTRPTVTDANVVLGRVDPSWFAGGRMTLDIEAARGAVAGLAGSLGLSTETLAEGICDVVNAKMGQAIRTLTVEKGIEPRDFSLVAFGGAGAMHAVFLARELEIGEVIVPPLPGAFSAWGMLETELRRDFSLSYYASLERSERAELVKHLDEMESEGRADLRQQGVGEGAIRVEHAMDLRYEGQEYTLVVPLSSLEEVRDERFAEIVGERFHAAHHRRFGHANAGAPMEIVVLRTTVFGDLGRPEPEPQPAEPGRGWPSQRRQVIFGHERHDTDVVHRADLPVGARLEGPAIVAEETATTVLPPGASLEVNALGAIVIDAGR